VVKLQAKEIQEGPEEITGRKAESALEVR